MTGLEMDSNFVLASASPRRWVLLKALGLEPVVEPTRVDESWPDDDPDQAVVLAEQKLEWSLNHQSPGTVVLAADTIVRLGNRVLGKPEDADEARAMLASLADRDHIVTSGVAIGIAGGMRRSIRVDSTVHLNSLSTERIAAYVAGGSPLDKAGAYAVQDAHGEFPDFETIRRADRQGRYQPAGSWLVGCVIGSLSNVIGLPLGKTVTLLRAFGIEVDYV